MKLHIAILMLGLVAAPLVEAAQTMPQSDNMDCAWGDASFDDKCIAWAARERALDAKLVAMARAHETTRASSKPNTLQVISVASDRHSLPAAHN